MNNLKISDFITKESISLNMNAKTKVEALSELVDITSTSNNIVDKEECFDALVCRETLGSTGIGKGVAVPHAKTCSVKKLTIGFGISREGVDFEAIDYNPVKIFFLFASPFDKDDLYLHLLAHISRLIRSEEFRDKLLNAKDENEIIRILEEN